MRGGRELYLSSSADHGNICVGLRPVWGSDAGCVSVGRDQGGRDCRDRHRHLASWKNGGEGCLAGGVGRSFACGVFFGVNPIAILFGGGLVGMLARRVTGFRDTGALLFSTMVPRRAFVPRGAGGMRAFWLRSFGAVALASAATGTVVARPSIPRIALFFLKVGAVLYGGGYVLLAFLEQGLVQQHAWLTQQQLLDAVAIGQFTPGPVLSTATFIGYILGGVPGASVATVAIFLPSFFYVALLAPVLFRLRQSAWMAAFLDSVNVCAATRLPALNSSTVLSVKRTSTCS